MTPADGGRVRRCSSCGSEVAPEQRFCMACGTSLTSMVCPTCSTPVPIGARFCGHCGSRLEAATEALGSVKPETPRLTERRLVSVLFADLVGFTALSADEDPEAVREFLTAYFDRAAQVIDRYGGTVEKFIGDAVMAVWGTPTAHEDDAERAVRAALELTQVIGSLDDETRLRAAVMTGEAAVSPNADGQGLVAGDLVNTSSRLQGAAEPGQVLVDETTMVAAGRSVAFQAVGELTLKGKPEPMRAWAAKEVVAERGGGGRREVLEPPFVGRGEELRLLKDSLHAPGRDGKARLVTVIGQAGLGKSRLGWELRKYSDGVTEDVYWHEGQSPAYGEGVAYWALAEMVRYRCRIGEQQSPESARSQIAATLEEYVSDADERAWIEPRLGALIGVSEIPSGDQEELFAAWRTFFERIAEHSTVALIFEDLHWGDDSLLDFIEHLLEWSTDSAILVVCLARPELLERRPSWSTGHRAATTINLEPLPDDAIADMLRGLVPGCPEATLREVVARAEGVPLYAVETVRMLVDEGRLVAEGERYRLVGDTRSFAVPASLQALVTARLDALDGAERRLVQDASVLGKSFSRPALIAVSDQDEHRLDRLLLRLSRKQIVATESGRGAGADARYAFVQGLLREVAYSTLSRRDRRARHLAAARHYESLGDDELAGLVANHFYDAYRAVPDGGDGQEAAGWARAALSIAAERSVALHAYRSAVTFIDLALEITEDPAEQARLRVMAANPAWAAMGVDAGDRYITEAIDWYLANGYDAEADDAIATRASYLVHTGLDDELRQLLEARVARLDDETAGPEAPRLLNEMARAYMFDGEVDKAPEPIDRGIAITERLMLEPEMAELLATKSWMAGVQGHHYESRLFAEGGLEIAERNGVLNSLLRARMNLSDILIGAEPRKGLEMATGGVELAQRAGHASWAAGLASNEAMAALALGEWHIPIERAETLDRPEITPFVRLGLLGTAAVARAYLGRDGDRVPALDSVDPVTGDSWGQNQAAQMAYLAWEGFAGGELEGVDEMAAGSAAGTASYGEASLALAQAVHAMVWLGDRRRVAAAVDALVDHGWAGLVKVTQVTQGRAALAAFDGAYDAAQDGYRSALAIWERLDMRPDAAVARMEMLRLMGDHLDDADELAKDAQRILTGLGAVSLLERLSEVTSTPRVEVGT